MAFDEILVVSVEDLIVKEIFCCRLDYIKLSDLTDSWSIFRVHLQHRIH